MIVRELIRLLERFDPDSQVRLSVSTPDRVIETHEQLWVGDYGGGPQINTARDFRQFYVYAGCGLEQFVGGVPETRIDLGRYDTPVTTAMVHDFYVIHERLHEPLSYPEFDYQNWIPPRTVSGDYNPAIAKILREKLLRE
jgi:hypothetical protein